MFNVKINLDGIQEVSYIGTPLSYLYYKYVYKIFMAAFETMTKDTLFRVDG